MSRNSDKKLCEYIHILERLIMNILDNTELKNDDVNKRIDKLRNLLSKRGITPEEIENALSLNEPYDNNLEPLKNDLINENISLEINNSELFQSSNIKESISNFIQKKHLDFEKMGINLNEDQK